MSAIMSTSGPITSPGLPWDEQEARRMERLPRGWEGFKVDWESGLTGPEIEALRRTGQLAA